MAATSFVKTTTEYYRLCDIARLFGAHPITVARWKKLGQIPEPDLRVGRFDLWEKTSFDHWRESSGKGAK